MRSQGMQPSVRDRDLVTVWHLRLEVLGAVRSQTMRPLADLSHTPSTNCCQLAEDITAMERLEPGHSARPPAQGRR